MYNKRILVVDDERKIRDILKKVLSARGYDVRTASNGVEAFLKAKSFKPHLIIADIAMPEMDGYQLCKKVRNDDELYSIRFIFLTAKDTREDEIKGLGLGADDYITKPFDMEKLLARIEARLRWVEERVENGVLEGGLAGRNLIDILQILSLGQKTGIIEVYGEENGNIVLKNGVIVDAGVKSFEGAQAVYRILSMEEGKFRFIPKDEVEEKTNIQVTSIILEWGKLWDESRKKAEERKEKFGYEAFLKYMREKTQKA